MFEKGKDKRKKAKEKNAEPTLDIPQVDETLSLQSLLNNFKIEKI